MCRKRCLSLCAENLRMNSINYFQSIESSYSGGSIIGESKFLAVNHRKVILRLLT